ncbi:FMN-binding negative transcriptional regulator [Aeromicrobium phragmitis]|uniref:FMN-binding negative transcriptional regulator n=1 Tax=Aeromicrobium phragmitis TaxID=2478914 RepID=A0A3L8PIS9_9ACTN|nr:FMN-binding negative transcriptional regulator [Aeromicrobium phragmitis]RLV55074.1 FMN-binding negative transcriptional regulator [Aeromicrobium phragmitis]
MLVHPWDATLDDSEWRDWVATTDRFGVLAVNNRDVMQAPLVVPTHFTIADSQLLVHLARPNPVWSHLEHANEVRMVVTGDYAYVPSYWRAKDDVPREHGVPTSYYAAVQFVCRPHIVDDPQGKAKILAAQMADFQPEGQHAPIAAGEAPYGRMLPGIRGLRLSVTRVEAKFKYDDHTSVERRQQISDQLEQRGRGLDAGAASQQRRRTGRVGEWRP